AAKMPADFRVSITNAPGKTAYPIASFTWLLIPSRNADANKQKILIDFLNWMITDGQKMAPHMTYAPLTTEVATKIHQTMPALKQMQEAIAAQQQALAEQRRQIQALTVELQRRDAANQQQIDALRQAQSSASEAASKAAAADTAANQNTESVTKIQTDLADVK